MYTFSSTIKIFIITPSSSRKDTEINLVVEGKANPTTDRSTSGSSVNRPKRSVGK